METTHRTNLSPIRYIISPPPPPPANGQYIPRRQGYPKINYKPICLSLSLSLFLGFVFMNCDAYIALLSFFGVQHDRLINEKLKKNTKKVDLKIKSQSPSLPGSVGQADPSAWVATHEKKKKRELINLEIGKF